MNKKHFALSFISVLVAVACSPKEEQKTEKKPAAATASGCRHPSLATQLHTDLKAAIQAETNKFIQNDTNQFVDADKITAAADQLKVTINGTQDKDGQCRSKLSIVIPQNVQKVASTNAPLVGISQYDTIIEERMGSANFQFNGSTLTLPINFTVKGEPISVAQTDDAFQTAAAALTTALLPYGVKENVTIEGRSMTRDMALQAVQMNGGKIPTAPSTESTQANKPTEQENTSTENETENKPKPKTEVAQQPKPPVVTPKPSETTRVTPPATPPKPAESPEQKALREAKIAEAKAKLAAEKAAEKAAKAKAAREAAEAAKLRAAAEAKKDATPKQPEIQRDFTKAQQPPLTPNRTPSANTQDDDELESVRKAHRNADQEIKSSWKKISPEIQKELVEEQKSWEKQRNQRCRQAAAGAGSEAEANKLYMQCDTRMTKERVKNLEGYSIP